MYAGLTKVHCHCSTSSIVQGNVLCYVDLLGEIQVCFFSGNEQTGVTEGIVCTQPCCTQ